MYFIEILCDEPIKKEQINGKWKENVLFQLFQLLCVLDDECKAQSDLKWICFSWIYLFLSLKTIID